MYAKDIVELCGFYLVHFYDDGSIYIKNAFFRDSDGISYTRDIVVGSMDENVKIDLDSRLFLPLDILGLLLEAIHEYGEILPEENSR